MDFLEKFQMPDLQLVEIGWTIYFEGNLNNKQLNNSLE